MDWFRRATAASEDEATMGDEDLSIQIRRTLSSIWDAFLYGITLAVVSVLAVAGALGLIAFARFAGYLLNVPA